MGSHPGMGVSTRQCDIHHGTRAATVPGASTKNTADPTMATVASSCALDPLIPAALGASSA